MTKTEIALDPIDEAGQIGVPFETLIFDTGYGNNRNFLDAVESRGKSYRLRQAMENQRDTTNPLT